MSTIRSAIKACLLATALLLAAAAAADQRPYTPEAFAQLTQAGYEVVVYVHADWCPTCRRQAPVLAQLLQSPRYKDCTVLLVDFDTQAEALKRFHVAQQSTLIVYHGSQEKARATGITTPQAIGALLDRGL